MVDRKGTASIGEQTAMRLAREILNPQIYEISPFIYPCFTTDSYASLREYTIYFAQAASSCSCLMTLSIELNSCD